jgi:hypothetical protein
MKYSKTQDSVYCALCRFFGPKSGMSKEKTFNHGSSMLELRRDDLQLILIHYSFVVSVLYCYIWALNLKSTPKMTPNLTLIMTPNSTPKLTPNSTPNKTPDSTPCFTTCLTRIYVMGIIVPPVTLTAPECYTFSITKRVL